MEMMELLEVVAAHDRVGVRCTATSVKNAMNCGHKKAASSLALLGHYGLVKVFVRPHRSNVKSKVYTMSEAGFKVLDTVRKAKDNHGRSF